MSQRATPPPRVPTWMRKGNTKAMPSKITAQSHKLVDPGLLDKIDQLFACGVGDHIALPQLVVVGDQSSGKSSVLEGLTKLPFPRNSELCTRFPSQITFRRTERSKIAVSIIPSKHAEPEHEKKMRQWSRTEKDVDKLDRDLFTSIMKEVHEIMNIGIPSDGAGKRTFSEDVLRIEVHGPDQEHFSVVDVPGIFRKTTAGVTVSEDMRVVKKLVQGYMANPRSVMLAVVPANIDVANQDILTMAEEYDPQGIRTVGVLTKPDLVDSGGENAILSMLDGTAHRLNLGWYVVRNVGQKDLDDIFFDRDANEREFFDDCAPWSSVSRDRAGIRSLHSRLRDILGRHVRREFPKVKAEVQRRLKSAQQELSELGEPRETPEEQRQYLINTCTRFQRIATSALNSDYHPSEHFSRLPILRLPTHIVNRNEKFSDDMAQHGHLYKLEATSEAPVPECSPSPMEAINIRSYDDDTFFHDIEDIVLESDRTVKPPQHENAETWFEEVYRSSRGFELGTFNKSLLTTTMRTQSQKWELLALGYIGDAIHMVHTFISRLLETVCHDERICNELRSKLVDELQPRYTAASDHVKLLLKMETQEDPMTTNHYFNDNLESSRQQRMRAAIAKKGFNIQGPGGIGSNDQLVVAVDDIVSSSRISNERHTIREIHDILQSYYKVARKRFVDNVVMGASFFLLKGAETTPINLFSPIWIGQLSDMDLETIAGEDVMAKTKRASLKTLIGNLQEGKKILR